jgi:hypothetical protein
VGQLSKRGVKSLALSVLARTRAVPSNVPDSRLPKIQAPSIALRRHLEESCWHCGETHECDCVTCGVLKPSVVWASGSCAVCAQRSRIQ